jgi:uncharacterized C2H2 Zn-finger protein
MPSQQIFRIRINKTKKHNILSKMRTISVDSTSTESDLCFECPHCEKTFKQNGNLHTHMMRHHNTGKPSTRIDRNKVRKSYVQLNTRFITIEDINSNKPKRFTIHDKQNDSKLVEGITEKFSSRNAKMVVDNLNIILGLINNQNDIDFTYHWTNLADSFESLKTDRPKQTYIIDNTFNVITSLQI